MTATERLRQLLDERGVEYETHIEPVTGFEHVKWNFNEHGSADFNLEFGEPWLAMYGTISGPEQAVEATLGRGTCKMDTFADVKFQDVDEDEEGCYEIGALAECSECGAIVLMPPEYAHFDRESLFAATNFCPNCGAEVVE